jgi:lipopolysaccharide export system permease protein
MKRANAIVVRAIVPNVLLAWLTLIAVTALLTVKDEIAKLGGGYDINEVLAYLAFTTPRRAYDYFVYASVIGTITGLGQLAQSSELIALQSLGISKRGIVFKALAALGAMSLIVMAGAEIWGSYGDRQAQQIVTKARNQNISFESGSGLWIKDGNLFLNAKTVVRDDETLNIELWGVRILDFERSVNLRRVISAKTATYQEKRGWLLTDVRDQRFESESARLEQSQQMFFASQLEPVQISARALRPTQQSISELRSTIAYAKLNKLSAREFESAMWERVCFPVVVLALALAAASFAFASLRTGGLGRSIFIGLLIAMAFFVGSRIVSNLFQTFHWPALVAELLPALLIASFGIWRLNRR